MSEPYVDSQYPESRITARIIAAALEVHRTLGENSRTLKFEH